MGQGGKPPRASAGQVGADCVLFGSVMAVTFIPSGPGPAGARILITESISIEQPIYLSFRTLENRCVRPSRRPLFTRRRGRAGAAQKLFAEAGRVRRPPYLAAHSITSRARVSTALLFEREADGQ